jgi:YVTN family beta-propeller protein
MTPRLLLAAAVLALALAAGGLWWRATAPVGSQILFVSNYRADTVSVVDTALGREIRTLAVGDGPMGLAVRGGASPLLAVANSTAAHVTLIDPARLEPIGTVAVGREPEAVAFSPDGAHLYVTSAADRTVSVVDAAQRAVSGAPIAFDRKPAALAVAPDGTRLYVLLRDADGAVAAVDTATRRVLGTVAVGRSPTDLALTGDGTRLLAASFDDSAIAVIDTASLQADARLQAPTGMGLIAHPREPLVYSLASFDDSIAVVDFQAGSTVATIDVGQWPTYGTITADGRTLYVPNEDSDNVAEIDSETNSVRLRIAVGDEPAYAALFTPE